MLLLLNVIRGCLLLYKTNFNEYLSIALLLLTQLSASAQKIGYQIQIDFGGFELAGNIQQTGDSGLVVCGSASSSHQHRCIYC